MTYFGIATNLITYVIKVMHKDLENAVNSVNIWSGVTPITPLLGGFLADAYAGRFRTILFSALLYILGLGLFTASQYIPSLKPCNTKVASQCEHDTKTHEAVFFVGAYLVALATGGYRPCLESFGADQFDVNHTKERKQKMSFFNWWNVSVCCGLFLGVTLIVYIEDNVGWGVGFVILSVVMGITIVVFLLGRPFYRYRAAQGSPLKPMLQVVVAAVAKRKLAHPSDPSLLNEVHESKKLQGSRLNHTDKLRFLDKAAIIEPETGNNMRNISWRLAKVTQVEKLKLVINMIPIWLTCLCFSIGAAQGTTFFIKQASAMNRRITKNFEIPPASVSTLTAITIIITISIYDRILLPCLRRATGNERGGITLLRRMGIGMTIVTVSIMVSALVERKRMRAFQDGKILSVGWLAAQFIIIGIGDGFSYVGMQEYFYDQVPDSLRSLGMAFYLGALGVGSFMSTCLIIIVNSVTGLGDGKKWIGKDLNHSRLDYFYWFLTVIFVINMFVFVLFARKYTYKNAQPNVCSTDSCVRDDGVESAHV